MSGLDFPPVFDAILGHLVAESLLKSAASSLLAACLLAASLLAAGIFFTITVITAIAFIGFVDLNLSGRLVLIELRVPCKTE